MEPKWKDMKRVDLNKSAHALWEETLLLQEQHRKRTEALEYREFESFQLASKLADIDSLITIVQVDRKG